MEVDARKNALCGPQGVAGSGGNEGPEGPTGPRGGRGYQGWSGPQGTHSMGPQGFSQAGFQGPAGELGHVGRRGPRGCRGFQNPMGHQGFLGCQGTLGSQGAAGFDGAQGAAGSHGLQGAQGAQGAQAAVDFRSLLRVVKFMVDDANLQGHQSGTWFGTQGAQGVAGSYNGTQGPSGCQGPPMDATRLVQCVMQDIGSQGQKLFQGFQGTCGLPGVAGPQGCQGDRGKQGEQGGLGAQGSLGCQGVFGSQGLRGQRGIGMQGHLGTQGKVGRAGDAGPNGEAGPPGPQGLRGEAGMLSWCLESHSSHSSSMPCSFPVVWNSKPQLHLIPHQCVLQTVLAQIRVEQMSSNEEPLPAFVLTGHVLRANYSMATTCVLEPTVAALHFKYTNDENRHRIVQQQLVTPLLHLDQGDVICVEWTTDMDLSANKCQFTTLESLFFCTV